MDQKVIYDKNKFKDKYINSFGCGISISLFLLSEISEDKALLAGEFFGLIIATGKNENNVTILLQKEYEKYKWLTKWADDICNDLIQIGCNKELIITSFLNFWNRSEGRNYMIKIQNSNDINIANNIREKTGFAKSFYAICFSILFKNIDLSLYLKTENNIIQFINDINDLVSINKDLKDNVLNTLIILKNNNKSIKKRLIKCLNKILTNIENETTENQKIICEFMLNYIQWHLEFIKYKNMSEDHYKICIILKNIIKEYIKL